MLIPIALQVSFLGTISFVHIMTLEEGFPKPATYPRPPDTEPSSPALPTLQLMLKLKHAHKALKRFWERIATDLENTLSLNSDELSRDKHSYRLEPSSYTLEMFNEMLVWLIAASMPRFIDVYLLVARMQKHLIGLWASPRVDLVCKVAIIGCFRQALFKYWNTWALPTTCNTAARHGAKQICNLHSALRTLQLHCGTVCPKEDSTRLVNDANYTLRVTIAISLHDFPLCEEKKTAEVEKHSNVEAAYTISYADAMQRG